MKLKRITAILLVLVMAASLCGCGGNEIEAYESDTAVALTAESLAADTTGAATAGEESTGLDFEAAYAKYAPDEVIFTVEGRGVTWQELFYQIVYYTAILVQQEGVAITSMSDPCSLYVDGEGNAVPYATVVLDNAINTLVQYHIMDKNLTEAGIVLNKEYLDMIDALRQQVIDESFEGDEAAFLAYLDSVYCTEELWNWFNQVDAMYAQGFDHFYGKMGADYPDEGVMEYANGDENGAWTEYVQLRMICLYDEEETEAAGEEDGSGEAAEEPAGESSGEPTNQAVAQDILLQLTEAEDRDAAFAQLYAQYNEEAGLDPYPDGWCVYQGDIADEVYNAALAMETDEMQVVSFDGADVVVWKMPLDPDGGVMYDSANDIMYTLRYYAAWQEYASMVSGIGGWIETGMATAEWAEGFENLNLETVFA